jgi:alpha-glucosidase (family GH31 glycosyl hydrolase)
MFGM